MNIFKKEIWKLKKELREGNKHFPKDRMVRLPLSDDQLKSNARPGHERIAAFRSFHFVAQLFNTPHKVLRLSVNRTEIKKSGAWEDGITWDDLFWVKNQCGFQNCDAVEVYPRQEDFINDANMRHLFIMPEGLSMDFIWRAGKEEQHDQQSESGGPATADAVGGGECNQPSECPDRDDAAGSGGSAGQQDAAPNVVPMPTSGDAIR